MRKTRASPASAVASLLALAATGSAAAWLVEPPPGGVARASPQPLRFDVNRAPAHRLRLLPGIGPHRARAIVEERARAPFTSIAELKRVHGIGPVTVAAVARVLRLSPREGGP